MKKLLIRGLMVLAVVIALPFVAALVMPREFTVEREVEIAKSPQEVYDYMRVLENQPKFSMWAQLDPKMQKSFRGDSGEVGSVFAWNSEEENVGIGELAIVGLEDGKRIDLEIRFEKPFVSKDPTHITFEKVEGEKTRVKQVYKGKFNYPMNLLCFLAQSAIGDGMQKTLENLKGEMEK
ncbi:MAG: SRPBCC family protein [Pirellulales bacterium]